MLRGARERRAKRARAVRRARASGCASALARMRVRIRVGVPVRAQIGFIYIFIFSYNGVSWPVSLCVSRPVSLTGRKRPVHRHSAVSLGVSLAVSLGVSLACRGGGSTSNGRAAGSASALGGSAVNVKRARRGVGIRVGMLRGAKANGGRAGWRWLAVSLVGARS